MVESEAWQVTSYKDDVSTVDGRRPEGHSTLWQQEQGANASHMHCRRSLNWTREPFVAQLPVTCVKRTVEQSTRLSRAEKRGPDDARVVLWGNTQCWKWCRPSCSKGSSCLHTWTTSTSSPLPERTECTLAPRWDSCPPRQNQSLEQRSARNLGTHGKSSRSKRQRLAGLRCPPTTAVGKFGQSQV